VGLSTLPELTIGKTIFSNVKVSALRPIQGLTPCNIKIDGYLGNDIFSKGIVQIDMTNKWIEIASSIKSINVRNHNSIDFETSQYQIPFMHVKFPGAQAVENVMFDTGSSNYFYRLEKKVFGKMVKNGLIKGNSIIDTVRDSNGAALFGKQHEKEIYVIKFDSIDFAGTTIYNCPAYTYTGPYSILGAPFLRLGVVTIDYQAHKFYFKPYADTTIDLYPRHGFTLTSNKSGQLMVETVHKNSLAHRNGIQKNYILKKLNTLNIDSLTTCDLFTVDWATEYNKEIVEYTFLTTENAHLNVKIKNNE
jgi:hypothetical protein